MKQRNQRRKKKQRRPKPGVRRRFTQAPRARGTIVSRSNSSIRIRHREPFYDVVSEGVNATTVRQFPVNPAMPSVFPWLHKLGDAYETYKFHSLAFEYVPAIGSDTAGVIGIAPDYDAADVNTSLTRRELMSFADSTRSNIWQGFTSRCTPKNLNKRKEYYTRTGELAQNLDVKSYDALSMTLVFTSDKAATTHLGELHVLYDITFSTPEIHGATSASAVFDPTVNTAPFSGLVALNQVGGTVAQRYVAGALDTDSVNFTKPGTYLVNLVSENAANIITANAGVATDYGIWTLLENAVGGNTSTVTGKFVVGEGTSTYHPTQLSWNGPTSASLVDSVTMRVAEISGTTM